ncbi:MAG: PPOX class F420-dependent oxidoreductase [Actinomycetota bacterium]|nr:PPOX class F420-dependent oxidoreductase [Actinomycetota bacterium]
MTTLKHSEVRGVLEPANYATLSTHNTDGSIHSTVVWMSLEDGVFAVNGAQGRQWSNNIERNPHVTVCVFPADNPYEYVEIRGTTSGSREDADEHINRLAKRYIDQDEYPFRGPGEVRLKFAIAPDKVRYQKQG